MKYASIKRIDVANGVGVRVSVFVSGCTHHCKGCFNSEAWDFNYGSLFGQKQIDEILSYLDHDYIQGLSLLGGEPFEIENQRGLLPLLREVKKKFPQKDIWAYSGYLFDKEILDDMCKKYDETKEMISYIDVLIDGKFEMDKKDPKLLFRGSSNQRVIDVKKSLKEGKVVLHEKNSRRD